MAVRNLPIDGSPVTVTDDREACPKFWIAVYTRPRSEKKAAAELARLGVETYLPVQKQLRIWSDRKKYVDAVIIPMVLFARVSDRDILAVKRHPLILSVMAMPGERTPAHIPESQIECLRFMLRQSDIPVEFEKGILHTEDYVIVTNGKLKGLVGQVKSVNSDSTTIWVNIDIMGGALVRIKSHDVERHPKPLLK